MQKQFTMIIGMFLLASATMLAQAPIPIATAKQQALGSKVTKVAGRVTAGAGVFRNTAFLQDGTAGIAVFNNTFRLGVQVGDSVVIENGTLSEFQATSGQPGTGLTQLVDSIRFTVVPVSRQDATPRTVTIDLVVESLEAQLVRIRRVRFTETGTFRERTYQVIDRDNKSIDVRIDGGTEIARNAVPIPEGEFDIIGLVSQFRGTYQIQPRFVTELGLPPLEVDTVAKSRTLDVTTWNLDWFGWPDSTKGPTDKDRQIRSVRQAMDTMKSDIYGLEEITSEESVKRVADSIVGNHGYFYASDIPTDQRMAFIYNKETITPISTGLAVNGGSQAWAGGRFPYRMTFDAQIVGKAKRMVVFVIHAKATDSATGMEDYNRRKTDAETFHAYLNDFYKDSAVIVIGDFNDEVIKSVVDSTLPSPYRVFANDAANWSILTESLDAAGASSYIRGTGSMLDNLMATNEVLPMVYRTFIESPNAYLSSYTTTVSDHLPVTTRFYVDGTTDVNDETSASASSFLHVAPNPMSAQGRAELVIERAGTVRASMINALGEEVAVLLNEECAPQVRLLQIPAQDLSVGMYSLRVRMNNVTVSTPVVIAR
ncbi:MAG: hypothetical protein JSS89_12525 [Bacteroidetes bacterium]|nr:hypothetical protein [Bacteroidota bacterium]